MMIAKNDFFWSRNESYSSDTIKRLKAKNKDELGFGSVNTDFVLSNQSNNNPYLYKIRN